jgi:phosphate transport system protein
MNDHTSRSYEEELSRLKDLTATMGELTQEQLEGVLEAIERFDKDLAARVIEREPEADRLEHQIDSLVVRMLALRQPVAVDLREILTGLRTANELERICDYAEDVAGRIVALHATEVAPTRSLINLGQFAAAMVKDAMRAYGERNAQDAQSVWLRDKEVDEMYTALFRELLTYMMEDPRRISASTQMLFIARAFERVGDRATNIAEMVNYMVRGETIEEPRPKGDTTKTMVPPSES